jgi:alkanesulfonate monooxygenase SsuD/methylene tetrahydromethanopterin reductase-like flavin-dependent oxidoreductase (luciferase family)
VALALGCHLPMFGPVATRETLLAFARRMEALGFDSLWASDHVAIPHRIASRYPYIGPRAPGWSPVTAGQRTRAAWPRDPRCLPAAHARAREPEGQPAAR